MYFLKFAILATAVCGAALANAQTDIAKIDKNFAEKKVSADTTVWHNALKSPFKTEGFAWREDGGELYRVSKNLNPQNVSPHVLGLAKHTSGGAIRFATDSKIVKLRYKLRNTSDMAHMTRCGATGFDVFINPKNGGDIHIKNICPSYKAISQPIVEERLAYNSNDASARVFTIWLPLYGGVENLEIGLDKEAKILPPPPHKIAKPILFYGSSITQGGCASRPGNNYTTMLCRELDAEQINLGFSGNAKGEIAVAKDIASLDLAAFVYDYDYNAPNAEHLANTHEKFFLEIRKARPNLPIIIMTRCSHNMKERSDVIERTYKNAIKRGDKNVYFIDGNELFGGIDIKYPTVDGCHPTDLGFYMMYKRVLPTLKETLNKNN